MPHFNLFSGYWTSLKGDISPAALSEHIAATSETVSHGRSQIVHQNPVQNDWFQQSLRSDFVKSETNGLSNLWRQIVSHAYDCENGLSSWQEGVSVPGSSSGSWLMLVDHFWSPGCLVPFQAFVLLLEDQDWMPPCPYSSWSAILGHCCCCLYPDVLRSTTPRPSTTPRSFHERQAEYFFHIETAAKKLKPAAKSKGC